MSASTVVRCFCQLFSLFGMPQYIHSYRGSNFMSSELKDFLHSKGIATSHTTPYNPRGNGQVERLNGTLWKTITLALKSRGLRIDEWELVLLDSLHSLRSLLSTATNETRHERIFRYNRKSTTGTSLPSWLTTPGTVLMRRNVRPSKFDPFVDEVELLDCNPQYAESVLKMGRNKL
ncbi:pro-pol polyprotein [Plakobranchus ocellatus]|uniref:Pro-pol polyprotein n=1 Tax=Plakobranchus ocellatus TaxID=259542 RepID=A0AAV4CE89_9GAST|nr:pro-pol polyprotein [Plakobranchus ocellatus]